MSLEREVFQSIEKSAPKLVVLTQELIRQKSVNPPGDVSAVAQILQDDLSSIGMDVTRHTSGAGMVNLQAVLKGAKAKPRFLFNGHTDVVTEGDPTAWTVGPFDGAVKGGFIFGRGAADMKGGLAAVASCLRGLVESGVKLNGEVVFHAVADEEADSINGTKYMIKKGLAKADMGIVAEGSVVGGTIALRPAVRGNCWLKLTTHGRAAHASNPSNGVNAVLEMSRLLLALEKVQLEFTPHKLLPPPTISPGTVIRGGSKTNVIPERCEAEVDVRLVPGMTSESVVNKFNEIIKTLKTEHPKFSASVEPFAYAPAAEIDESSPVIAAAKKATKAVVGYEPKLTESYGTNDGAYLILDAGIPVICGFGPGDHKTGNQHGADENVSITALVNFAKIYALTLMYALGYQGTS
ncbi:MAG: M20 family metallopeptidase [Candidatus Bathyarchaeia archaeon]